MASRYGPVLKPQTTAQPVPVFREIPSSNTRHLRESAWRAKCSKRLADFRIAPEPLRALDQPQVEALSSRAPTSEISPGLKSFRIVHQIAGIAP